MPRTKRLNDTQLRLIQAFEFVTSKKDEEELMGQLREFYIKKFYAEREKLINSGIYTQAYVDEYIRTHHHGKLIK